MRWISADGLAALSGVTLRAAQKVCARALAGQPWRGNRLEVRLVPSRGGASGTAYEVAVSSLPPDLAAKLARAAPPPVPRRLTGAGWRLALVQSIQGAGPAGSPERAEQLRAVAARAVYPSGARAGEPIAERTLRGWVAQAEAGGAVRLGGGKRRADRGAARVIAWRAWDRAMQAAGVPEARQREVAARLDAEVRGLWAAGEVSAANIQFSMTVRCQDIAEAEGLSATGAERDALCRIPLHFIGHAERRRARMAHKRRNDAAGWHANHVPRVRRHRAGLRPMDLVAVDVRHSDIVYRRPDGSLATPKVIAFLDLATNRLFARPFLLPKGEMIRREHVLETLRELAADPAWGLWRGLYLDNGGEFNLGGALDDLTHLVDLVRRVHGGEAAEAFGNIKSRPYNPQSKVIEGIFSAFTRSIEPVYPGFIGGNRMAKKTQNQGRAPVPMPGDEAAILARFAEMVRFYNAKPQQKGHIKGRSPDAAFAAYVSEGWRAIVLDRREFALAFGPDEWRKVQPGGELHVRNQVLAHPGLTAMVGEPVRVRLPVLAPGCAVLLNDRNEPVLVAEALEAVAIREAAGARPHGRNRAAATDAAKGAAKGAARMDARAARLAAMARLPAPEAAEPLATAVLHPVLREAAEAAPLAPLPSRRDAYRAREKAEIEAARAAVLEAIRDVA
jgi:hypothetical protein